MEIVEFLRHRLDEDEQGARAAGNRHWLVQDNIIELYPEREDDGFMSWPTRADARHAAAWGPARVLREVEAKRLRLAMLLEAKEQAEAAASEERTADAAMFLGKISALLDVAKVDAVVHADHPDYREEWRL